MQAKPPDFGRLTVIGEGPRSGHHRRLVCRCECGTVKAYFLTNLKSGDTTSCGCASLKHGRTKTRLYRIWAGMLQRCENPKHTAFSRYGGVGITVCDAWHNFEVFAKWADSHGHADGLSIDRKKSHLGYSPSNCRWSTDSEQNMNRGKATGKSSRFIGVSWHSRQEKWAAYIQHQGRLKYLGLYADERAAAEARDVAAKELHGEFARLNFAK